MRILHLAPDEKKFVPVAAEIFNSREDIENRFLVLASDVTKAQKYFFGQKSIRVVNHQYVNSEMLEEDFAWCDCLVLHFLDPQKAKAVMRAPNHLPVIWSGWGGDYCDLLPQGGNNLLGDETRRLVKTLDKQSSWSPSRLIQKLKEVKWKTQNAAQIKKIIKRVDFFSSPFPEDFELLKTHLGKDFRPTYTRIFYGSVERTYLPGAERVYGKNILVGNSATATNNHLEVFKMLSQLDIEDRKIIVPLSYGDAAYRNAIIIRGRALFGERFQPVVEFMPLDQYNTLIAQCSVVLMGHRRQQGGGNTVTMLHKGAKVYLDEVSTVYQYLKNRGAFIYTLQDLQKAEGNIFDPINDEQKCKNREVLDEYAGDDVVSLSMGDFVQQIRMYGANNHA